MISKEEMYEFASQIAGITDADLEAYRCGGKTKTKKMSEGDNIFKKIKKGVTEAFTPIQTQIDKEIEKRKRNGIINIETYPGMTKDVQEKADQLRRERQQHPERFNENGSRKYNKNNDLPTNEDVKQDWMKKKRKK